jgi:hypothetical protein
MKIALSVALGLLALAPAQAQVFGPRVSVGVGYSRGGWHHDGGHYRGHVSYRSGYYWGPSYVRVWPGYSYGYGYYPGYDTAYYPYSYGTTTYGGSGAANGLVLGALAGGIIGNNSGEFHHNGLRGAAWGAGVGWLLGTIADSSRRVVYQAPVQTQPQVVYAQPAATAAAVGNVAGAVPTQAAQPQQVTIINNYYGTSAMSQANGMFGR